MSHSSASLTSTTQPLSDILPWGAPMSVLSAPGTDCVDARTLLVTDACATDGRFLLHTLALQFMSSRYTSDDAPRVSDDGAPRRSLEGAVLWISFAPVTENLIVTALRKLQHTLGHADAAGAARSPTGGHGGTSRGTKGTKNGSGRIHVVSVPLELAEAALEQQNEEHAFSRERYLRRLHGRVVHWLDHRTLPPRHPPQQGGETSHGGASRGPNAVILDNVTALGALFGVRSTNAFVSSVRSSVRRHANRCSRSGANAATSDHAARLSVTNVLAVRASSPDDGGVYRLDADGTMDGERPRADYARLLRPWWGCGAGRVAADADDERASADLLHMEELSHHLSLGPRTPPSVLYSCGLYETADGIVDVSPLESGYSRDVLGRLSFVAPWSGAGWWGRNTGHGAANGAATEVAKGTYASVCVNYRCDDSGVRIMRLRT